MTLNGLAELHRAHGDYEAAEPEYARALSIREKALGSGHPDVALILDRMASLYEQTGRHQEAQRLKSRAEDIRKIER